MDDLEEINKFLIRLFEITPMFNWFPVRFENSCERNAADIRIWEEVSKNGTSDIVAVANPESKRLYFIQIHPGYKHLEDEIIQWIVDHCETKYRDEKGKKAIAIFCRNGDKERQNALEKNDFVITEFTEIFRSRLVDLPVPDDVIPEGYTVRCLDPDKDGEKYRDIIRLVFKHDHLTAEAMKSLLEASFYLPDLDIVAIAPDGNIASFCTIRFDKIGRIASLEPLGTHPDYRRKGLARIVLHEALRRSIKYNPVYHVIEGAANTPEANKFYESTEYTEKVTFTAWKREF